MLQILLKIKFEANKDFLKGLHIMELDRIFKKLSILFLLLFSISLNSCNYSNTHNSSEKSKTNDIDYYDIQIGYYLEKTHFYRIKNNGIIEYMQKDGDYGILKSFENVNFDKNAKDIGKINQAKSNEFNSLIKKIISTKSSIIASDTPVIYIYEKNNIYKYYVLHDEPNYTLFNELFDFFNKNTKVKLNNKIY